MRRLEWLLTVLLLIVVVLALLAYMGGCNMAVGFPDWTRAVRLLGIDADGNLVTLRTDAGGMLVIPIQGEDSEGDLQPVLVDSSGRIIMVAYGTIEVGGEIDVVQTDSIREVQGAEGATLRTLAVDASGQLIMVPRGQAGNYMAVDASGFLSAILKGEKPDTSLANVALDASGRIIMVPYGTTTVEGTATVTQDDSVREMQGADGETLRTVVVDAAGRMIMVPRGESGHYMLVDSAGFLSAILKGEKPDTSLANVALDASGRIIMVPYGTTTVEGTATVTQDDSVREMQGADGETLRTVVVDAAGRMIMVPRGESGYYMAVDASGNLTTVMKGLEGANLRTLVVDASGNLIAVMKGLEGANLRTIAVDASGQIIMVPRGLTGNYMAIDSNGYMTAVLKGIHDATLTTIALDASGRIYGYQVDDLDQWGKTLLVGNAEQAARLGSVISWDRRGQVQLINNFSKGMGGYTPSGDGDGWAVALDPNYFQSGGYSVKLTGGSSGANRNAGFTGGLGLPPSDTVGFALRWSSVATPDYLRLQLTVYKGGTAYFGYVRYDFDANRLQYMDTGGTYQNLAVQEILVSAGNFNSLKLVIDVDASKYVRVLLNNTEYDLSAYALLTSASGTKGQVVFSPMVYSHSGDNDIVYIDYVAITTRED